jgi:hypothetical protein
MTADAIELELWKPLGSFSWFQKNQTTKGPPQLQFNCVGCHFCGALWPTPVRKTSLRPPVLLF